MNINNINFIQGKRIEVLEMLIKNIDNQLQIRWKIDCDNSILKINFYNVSRFRMGELSAPLEVIGFEIISHSQDGWDRESAYEIRDFEEGHISFYCESFEFIG